MSTREIDPERLKDFAKRVFDQLGGAVTAALVHLGDALGLYRALREGPATSAELAERTGLDERWVREWLRNQGAAGLLEWDEEERFALTPEGEAVLADEEHPAFGAGLFSQLPGLLGVVEKLPEAFRTGVGLSYDALGPEGARGVERGFAPWYRHFLLPLVRAVEGLPERLEQGGRAADVGCGGAVALCELARAFPRAELHGYELSRHALERAEANRRAAGATGLRLHEGGAEALRADAPFDAVLTFDCLHDMTRPQELVRALRAALRDDGVWLLADLKARPTFAENVRENPMSAMLYGFSVLTCMSSALSEPGGAGLGTLGLPEERARAMAEAAGFTRFRRIEAVDHPVNAFYEIRP